MTRKLASRVVLALLGGLVAGPGTAQDVPPPSCEASETYHALDFWIGDWDVYVGDRIVGHGRIEKILDGCALIEHWSARDGDLGKSLFFVDYDGHWVQVWVTGQARSPGGVKEKLMVDDAPAGTVQFQGVVRHPEAGQWLDRTTLTPDDDGTVHQLIEVSEDNGASWYPTFDAIYRPAAAATGPDPR